MRYVLLLLYTHTAEYICIILVALHNTATMVHANDNTYIMNTHTNVRTRTQQAREINDKCRLQNQHIPNGQQQSSQASPAR